MCEFMSGVVTYKNRRCLYNIDHDSHSDILAENDIRDCNRQPNFVRVELTPKDGNIFNIKKTNWKLKVDQDYVADWFNAKEAAALMWLAVKDRVKQRFITKCRPFVGTGTWYLYKKGKIDSVGGDATIAIMTDNSQIGAISDNVTVTTMSGRAKINNTYGNSNIVSMMDDSSILAMHENSQVHSASGHSSIEAMFSFTRVRYLFERSKITWLSGEASVGAMAGHSKVSLAITNSRIYSMRDSSSVSILSDKSSINTMYDRSVVKKARGWGVINLMVGKSNVELLSGSSVVLARGADAIIIKIIDHSVCITPTDSMIDSKETGIICPEPTSKSNIRISNGAYTITRIKKR